MNNTNKTLTLLLSKLGAFQEDNSKVGFQDAAALQSAVSPEAAATMQYAAPVAGAAPMGADPMAIADPSMVMADPSMAAGGMVDPGMADPAAAGMVDPSMAAPVEEEIIEPPPQITEDQVRAIVEEAVMGKKKAPGGGKIDGEAIMRLLKTILIAVTAIASQSDIYLPPEVMLALNNVEPPEGGAEPKKEEAPVPAEMSAEELVAPAKEASLEEGYSGTPYAGADMSAEVQRTIIAQRLRGCRSRKI